MALSKRVREWEEPVTLYEIIPPPESAPEEEVVDMAAFIRTLLHEHRVDAVNIPEVRNETRGGARLGRFLQKMDPREFGRHLRKASGEAWDIVVNHSPVHEPPETEAKWFEETYADGYTDIVLVGGESSKIRYPGPSVNEAARLAREVASRAFPNDGSRVLLGGITLPDRRRRELDEPERLLAKQRAGLDFFTSQVLFEPESAKALLHDYDLLCRREREEPRPVFLSFAPVTGRKDVEFLEWLGVTIPNHAREWILGTGGRAIDRGARVAEHAFREILRYAHSRELRVPIGLNVEHVMRYNLDASEVLLDRLESLIEWHRLEYHA
ncbi:MAG TPA: hypothetical protein VM681_07120 [Candidatus Thermoplasmatota archaeon]|nr:hypothetical protein [Candidatus Thermoplasmatota archaeon]